MGITGFWALMDETDGVRSTMRFGDSTKDYSCALDVSFLLHKYVVHYLAGVVFFFSVLLSFS